MLGGATGHRARRVLALPAFRRLWLVTGLCSSADWLTMLALTGLASTTASSGAGVNFAFSGVLFANLIPGLLFAPLGGLLADRLDRRVVMVIADLVRCAVLVTIVVANNHWWIFAGTFLVQSAAVLWIPCKDAALPNLLRRPDQLESATQLGLVMTYGVSVVVGGGLFTLFTGAATTLHLPTDLLGANGWLKLAIVAAALFYLASAVMIAVKLPELARPATRPAGPHRDSAGAPGFRDMLRDAVRYVRGTPVIRGLLIGMMGALAAGGAVVGAAQPYALSLRGGQAAFGLLLLAVFAGLVTGLLGAPKLIRKVRHERLFGVAIVLAGLTLLPVALSPQLAVSLVAVALVGACAGAAFLTGITIIGSQVEDAMRGRINALYQAMLKVVLGCSVGVTPALITLVSPRNVELWGRPVRIDGSRPVILAAGLIAVIAGIVAHRQMSPHRGLSLIALLRKAFRRRSARRQGLVITVEGATTADTAHQAARLAAWLRDGASEVALVTDPALHEEHLDALLGRASLSGMRARALVAAAVRADLVDRVVRPALDAGAIVVMERYVGSPGEATVTGLDSAELDSLGHWAAATVRPDLVVMLDGPTTEHDTTGGAHWPMGQFLAGMAAAHPERYLVVDADGAEDVIGERVRFAVWAALSGYAIKSVGRGLGVPDPPQPLSTVESGK